MSAVTRRPASTSGIQYLASSHMPSNGSASLANHRGTTSSDSAGSPAKSAVMNTSADSSQHGLVGDLNRPQTPLLSAGPVTFTADGPRPLRPARAARPPPPPIH